MARGPDLINTVSRPVATDVTENEVRATGRSCALADVEWKPVQPAAKVVCAAASYLAKLPKWVAWESLQKLRAKAPSREHWIRELIEEYEKNN